MTRLQASLSYGRVVADTAAPVVDSEATLVSGDADSGKQRSFEIHLDGFDGPFDLLLSLIAKKKLEVTALALHQVTDDFVQHVRAQGDDWDLDETTEFLVVAAILLDLKAARLLPGESEEDLEDLALLEARDLLFARLLQYRAFKSVSELFEETLHSVLPRTPRTVGLDPHLAELLPDVVMDISGEMFANIAISALRPKPPPTVAVEHVHAPTVNVREQALATATLLRQVGSVSFQAMIAECPDLAHVIARFLGILQLYTERVVEFEQTDALSDLVIAWIGDQEHVIDISGEFDAVAEPRNPPPAEETHV